MAMQYGKYAVMYNDALTVSGTVTLASLATDTSQS